MSGIMPLARKLGEYVGRSERWPGETDPIPPLEPIERRVWRPNRESYWPPKVWAEMQRIYNGEPE